MTTTASIPIPVSAPATNVGHTSHTHPANAATTSPKIFLSYEVSDPFFYEGNKYAQHVSELTQSHVKKTGPNRGVRMEDYAAVHRIKPDHFVAAIADGHGSVNAISELINGKWEGTCYIGARECAVMAVKECINYILESPEDHRYAQNIDVGYCMRDAFAHAQAEIVKHVEAGARTRGVSEDLSVRKEHMCNNRIDGEHFTMLYQSPAVKKALPRLNISAIEKTRLDYPTQSGTNESIVVYQDATGKTIIPADYGCTLTTIIGLPPLPSSPANDSPLPHGRLLVGNAGDSDVYLFHRVNDKFTFLRVTIPNSTLNPLEVARLLGQGSKVKYRHISPAYGNYTHHGLMPSRALGHVMFRHHGITHVPHVNHVQAFFHDDVMIAASDGLWDGFMANEATDSHVRQRMQDFDNERKRAQKKYGDEFGEALLFCRENRAAARMCAILDTMYDTAGESTSAPWTAKAIGQGILDLVKRNVQLSGPDDKSQDNLSFIVVVGKRIRR